MNFPFLANSVHLSKTMAECTQTTLLYSIYVSQGSVATRFKCGEIFNDNLIAKFLSPHRNHSRHNYRSLTFQPSRTKYRECKKQINRHSRVLKGKFLLCIVHTNLLKDHGVDTWHCDIVMNGSGFSGPVARPPVLSKMTSMSALRRFKLSCMTHQDIRT